jgi:putative hydrolase of the HAD superfamily
MVKAYLNRENMIKAVLFDWGHTVMEELPGMYGAMADWKRVEATPGVQAVLEGLRGRVKICLATNAAESDGALVRKALGRVDLDRYFDAVYTARDLGLTKPAPAYFHAIAADLGLPLEECLMVGNSFQTDANGAAAAGLKAIWLKRGNEPLWGHPMFDVVLPGYDGFEAALAQINNNSLPGFETSLGMLREAEVRKGLFRHVQKVALTAYAMAIWILENDGMVDPILAHRAGLLHDIDKQYFTDDNPHGQLGAQMVQKAGYGLLSGPIRSHQVLSILWEASAPSTLEAKLVYLADKLVEKDQFVGVDARLDHLIERYGENSPELAGCRRLVKALEAEIAGLAGVPLDRFEENLRRVVDRVDVTELTLR